MGTNIVLFISLVCVCMCVCMCDSYHEVTNWKHSFYEVCGQPPTLH